MRQRFAESSVIYHGNDGNPVGLETRRVIFRAPFPLPPSSPNYVVAPPSARCVSNGSGEGGPVATGSLHTIPLVLEVDEVPGCVGLVSEQMATPDCILPLFQTRRGLQPTDRRDEKCVLL